MHPVIPDLVAERETDCSHVVASMIVDGSPA